MTLQELDLTIEHRSGKSNANADALSRCPVSSPKSQSPQQETDGARTQPRVQVLTQEPGPASSDRVDNSVCLHSIGGNALAEQQESDPCFGPIVRYLTHGTLPDQAVEAQQIMAESTCYEMVDGILFQSMPDKTLRTAVPVPERKKLFEEVHAGTFGAHQREAKTCLDTIGGPVCDRTFANGAELVTLASLEGPDPSLMCPLPRFL